MSQKENFKLTKLEKQWILYDVGNSAFILLVSTIFPIYFNYLAAVGGISEETALIYWGYTVSFGTVCVAILGPILGTFADLKDTKKKLLMIFMISGSILCFLLGFTSTWFAFLVVFIMAKISYALSLIFYDAMLIDVTNEERMDKVSSFGYAFGYVGSCIPFILSLIFVLFYDKIGISFSSAIQIAFGINAFWWFLMSVPILKNFKQIHYSDKKAGINSTFSELYRTFLEITKNKKVFLFIIAFFFYIDGVYTIIDMATAYGKALGLDDTGLLLALLVTQIVAFPCAIIFGRLSNKYKSEKLLSICVLAYVFIAIFAIFLSNQTQFWILAVLVGMFQGGIQALSRSHFGKIIPPEKAGEYYGILDICGKGAAFLGTMLVSMATQISGNSSIGVSIIAPLILLGYIFFRKSIKISE